MLKSWAMFLLVGAFAVIFSSEASGSENFSANNFNFSSASPSPQATAWGLSYDLIEVSSKPLKQKPPLLPQDILSQDPSASISRLSVVQVVDTKSQQTYTMIADIDLPYLVEVFSSLAPKQRNARTRAYIYKITDQGLAKIKMPEGPATGAIIDMSSSTAAVWDLVHLTPKVVNILEKDNQGRPIIITAKESPNDKVYLKYQENSPTPYLLQTISLEEEQMQTSTIVVRRSEEQDPKNPWKEDDILKSATKEFLTPNN